MADDNIPLSEDTPISIEGETSPTPGSGVRAIGAAAARGPGLNVKSAFKRPLNVTGQGATRCRIFRTRIAAAALEFMETQINQWLDSENIEVKEVGHLVGTMEGKTPEPNIVVMVWY